MFRYSFDLHYRRKEGNWTYPLQIANCGLIDLMGISLAAAGKKPHYVIALNVKLNPGHFYIAG